MKNFRHIFILFTIYFHVLLFTYASFSKLLDFENFQIQLAQSPLLSAYAGIISYSVIITELLLSLLLCISKSRLIALYSSLYLMIGFSVYIYLILNFSDFIPCSCGGILEKLGWTEHLIFNIFCDIILLISIYLLEKTNNRKIINTFVATSISMMISASMVYILFLNSEYIIKEENNFTRRFPHHPTLEDTYLDLGVNSYYFAGINKDEVYLGNTTSPLTLISIDKNFKNIKKHPIFLEEKENTFKSLRIVVKAPYFYLYDGSIPIIYRGKLGQKETNVISYKNAYFDQLQVIDSVTFAVRSQSHKSKKQIFGILSLSPKPKLNFSENSISIHQKNIFDVDGKLLLDDEKIYYVFYYKNKILINNHKLQKPEYFNTIDTIREAKIKIITLSNGHQKMGAPPLMTNKNPTVYKSILFNHSNLIGKHENKKQWSKSSIIDVYNTKTKKYWGSFYIQNRGNNKMSQMLVSDKYMYILIGQEIVRYRLAQTIQEQFKIGEAENLK